MWSAFDKFRTVNGGRDFKLFLTGLCLVAWVLSVALPQLQFHGACLALLTNVLWIWGE